MTKLQAIKVLQRARCNAQEIAWFLRSDVSKVRSVMRTGFWNGESNFERRERHAARRLA